MIGLIVILGSPNDSNGNISKIGIGRLETGLKEYLKRSDKNWKILLTGGFGEHFNSTNEPHAFYAKKYLMAKGISEDSIIEFALSSNTVDDALKARTIVEKYDLPELLVISSDFHMSRVEFIFNRVFPDCILSFVSTPYLNSVSIAERDKLLEHEEHALNNLKKQDLAILASSR